MRTLQRASLRSTMLQIVKQFICLCMVLIVVLPILLTIFAAFKTRGDMVNTSP